MGEPYAVDKAAREGIPSFWGFSRSLQEDGSPMFGRVQGSQACFAKIRQEIEKEQGFILHTKSYTFSLEGRVCAKLTEKEIRKSWKNRGKDNKLGAKRTEEKDKNHSLFRDLEVGVGVYRYIRRWLVLGYAFVYSKHLESLSQEMNLLLIQRQR